MVYTMFLGASAKKRLTVLTVAIFFVLSIMDFPPFALWGRAAAQGTKNTSQNQGVETPLSVPSPSGPSHAPGAKGKTRVFWKAGTTVVYEERQNPAPTDHELQKADQLVVQLDDQSFFKRESASQKLLSLARKTNLCPFLVKTEGQTKHNGGEVQVRIRAVIQKAYPELFFESKGIFLPASVTSGHYALRVARLYHQDRVKYTYVIDGRKEKEYAAGNKVGALTFSPDGRHWVYTVWEDQKVFNVYDGHAQKKYDFEERTDYPRMEPHFSPDGRHWAYIANEGGKEGENFIVYDGQEQKKYDDVMDVVFSPHHHHWAYIGYSEAMKMRGKNWFLVYDGRAGKNTYTGLSNLTFSPDGRHFAYVASDGHAWFIVYDGVKQQGVNDLLNNILFSPDGRHWAYVVQESGKINKMFVVYDGHAQKKYDSVVVSRHFFSSDSRHWWYAAQEGNKIFHVYDGVEQSSSGFVSMNMRLYIFSPDGRHKMYIKKMDKKGGNQLEPERYKFSILYDGVESAKEYDNIVSPVFSPDGRHWAYIGQDRNPLVQRSEKLTDVAVNHLVVSPVTLAHFHPVGKQYIAIDGKEIGAYALTSPVVFSPNSHFALFYAVERMAEYAPRQSSSERPVWMKDIPCSSSFRILRILRIILPLNGY